MSEAVVLTWGRWTGSGDLDAQLKNRPLELGAGRPIKALMGWDGLAVLDPDTDVVDMCREFVARAHAESCGQCFPCRLGFSEMLGILEALCRGKGAAADVERLGVLAETIRSSSKCDIGRTSPRPVLDALAECKDDFLAAAGSGTVRPRGNYTATVTAPCIQACPSHVDVPRYVEQVRFGQTDAALDTALKDCALPGVVGRVCVRLCEFNCRRQQQDAPIAVKSLKRFAADCEHARGNLHDSAAAEFEAEKVAIIGAGPAGLACAYHLAQRGYRSTVFEALDEPGGMAAVGIPDYRLPRHILREEAQRMERMGAEFRWGVKVGVDVTMDDLHKEGFAATFLGMGAPNSMNMRCEGEEAGYDGFMHGIHFLKAVADGENPLGGTKMCVVGGGNVAMDCVRTARRLGFEEVRILYRRTEAEMPADQVEIDEAKEEGVIFDLLVLPVKIIADENNKVTGLECLRMELGEPDDSGRRRPVPIEGSNFVIQCGAMVPAIGQRCDVGAVIGEEGVEITRWGTLEVNELTGQSEIPRLFSGGDCTTGADTLIAALAAGKRAAKHIAQFIGEGTCSTDAEEELEHLCSRLRSHNPAGEAAPGAEARLHAVQLDPDNRVTNFEEVDGVYTPSEALREASRCLRCYRIALAAH